MRLRKGIVAIAGFVVLAAALSSAAVLPYLRNSHRIHPHTGLPLLTPGQDGNATVLFNGWKITPAGRHIATGDMLLGGAFSPDGKLLAVTNGGWSGHSLHIIDVATEKELAKVTLSRAWYGVAWAPDSKLIYVATGATGSGTAAIQLVRQDAAGAWSVEKALTLPTAEAKKICAAGLAISADGSTLYACNTADNNIYLLDSTTGNLKSKLEVGSHPLACALDKEEKRLYVTNWGGSETVVVDVTNSAAPKLTARLKTGAHPNALTLSKDGRLFVTCGSSDCVSVFDVKKLSPLETIRTALTPKAPAGSTPDALAISPDGHQLYVANADNNCLCAIDISRPGHSRIGGFIPTGWYPTTVFVSPDGRRIIAGSGKGTGSSPNPAKTPINPDFPTGFEYIARQLNGLISFIDLPSTATLAKYTRQTLANSPYHDSLLVTAHGTADTILPVKVGSPSPIKYVLYIIKENRTYDQVFGDVSKGNGDRNLTLFGQDVTPNHHALAEQFVLLDNLYCNGEVSQDGHPWSTSASANDFVERAWTLSYSGKPQPQGDDSLEAPPAGYLWEAALKKGLTVRSYGEYWDQKSFLPYHCAAFVGKAGPGNAPPGRDTDRASIFLKEFHEFEQTGKIPNLMVMSLGEDHTNGTRPGSYTPKAMVASNDQAIGRIVAEISHSKVWNQFAIFIIEDDAQNGPDHVDSHRTAGLVISPYIRRGTVDSTFYTTASMLRTMELILGLKPMTQYDAAATPMIASFQKTPDLRPYDLVQPRISLLTKNLSIAYGAKESMKMDFRGYDRVDEQALNQILWHSIKGANVPMPAPVRGGVVAANGRMSY